MLYPYFCRIYKVTNPTIQQKEDEAALYIRQQCLFSFEDALKMQPATRLEQIFATLDLDPIFKKLPVNSQGGPDGYDMPVN